MPHKVSREDAIEVIKKFSKFFMTNELPAYSSYIWVLMSNHLNGAWKPSTLCSAVRRDERGILSTARKELGIDLSYSDSWSADSSSSEEGSINDKDAGKVAHLMNAVKRWDCFFFINHPCIKGFYIRCVSLMIEAQTISEFERIFNLTCIVGLQIYEDSVVCHYDVENARRARIYLEYMIGDASLKSKLKSSTDSSSATPNNREHSPETFKRWDDESQIQIRTLLENNVKLAQVVRRKGRNLNPYYLPSFINQLCALSFEFPVWSKVTLGEGESEGMMMFL